MSCRHSDPSLIPQKEVGEGAGESSVDKSALYRRLTTAVTAAARGSTALFWPAGVPGHTWTQPQSQPHTQEIISLKKKKKVRLGGAHLSQGGRDTRTLGLSDCPPSLT